MMTPVRSSHRSVLLAYRELLVVLVAAAVGLTVQRPLRWVVHHGGIDTFLVVLVFATALTIAPHSIRQLPARWRQLGLSLAVGIAVLPALSWGAAHLVGRGTLREGVMTIGLAPCEIASIATTAMAGGDVALAAGILMGSTILTVVAAGPILATEVPGTSVHPGHVIVTLLLVVALPLSVGIGIRSRIKLSNSMAQSCGLVSTLAVACLVALIAAEVQLSRQYLSVVAALVIIVLVSALIGRTLAARTHPDIMKTLWLTMSMRDFAIAAGLASAAFGSSAAAPLGLYGILVLLWGMGSAGFLRARQYTA